MLKIILERLKSLTTFPNQDSFINSCVFKNIVLEEDYKSFEARFVNTNDPLELMLTLTENELKYDEMFFSVDPDIVIYNIETLFVNKRNPNKPEQIDRMNKIIMKFNEMKHLSEKEKETNYALYSSMHEALRHMSIRTKKELKGVLQNDIFYINSLKYGNNDSYVNSVVFSETEYFLSICPQLFQDNIIYENTLLKLHENCAKNGYFRKRYHQSLIKEMTELKK